MAYDFGIDIASDAILFRDGLVTQLSLQGVVFRKFAPRDAGRVLGRTQDEENEWVLESGGEIVAAGGVLFHYNPPYGDIYVEVVDGRRGQGYGSFLVQELKRQAYAVGKIPAARCNVANVASRRALQKAGMLPCARILTGVLAI
jgi:GNAT superfamily N-acetyltransferase